MTVNSQEFQNGERPLPLCPPAPACLSLAAPLYHVVQRSPSPVYMMPLHQLSTSSLCILVSSVTHPALLVAGLCFGLCSSLVACVSCLGSLTKQPEQERQVSIKVANIIPTWLSSAHRTDSTRRLDPSRYWTAPCHRFGNGESCLVTSSTFIRDLVVNSYRETGLNIRQPPVRKQLAKL